jgi:hypothetical protein
MDADATQICAYLNCYPGQFVSAREICRRADGKWRFREDERWALPVLQRLVEERVIEMDEGGHYRLVTKQEERVEEQQWVSPEVKPLLEQGGRNPGTFDLRKELNPAAHS